MNDDSERDSADALPSQPAPPSSRRPHRGGLRRRTATIATMGGLTAGAVLGGMLVSHAADSSSTASSSTSTGSANQPSGSTSSGSSSTSSGSSAASSSTGSNEDPTHEKGESAQREADENSGNFHPGGGPRGAGRGGLQSEDTQVVATAIGITTTQLQTELSGGKTIAAVAKEHNADVDALISTWVASENKEIDDRVASGALTQAQATQDKANTQQRVTDEVNGTHTGHRR